MKSRYKALVILLWSAWLAGVSYKTGRGARFDATDQIASLSRRARAAEEALEVMRDLWSDCVLREPIIFPSDTALRQTAQ